jgi:hypothetical protein
MRHAAQSGVPFFCGPIRPAECGRPVYSDRPCAHLDKDQQSLPGGEALDGMGPFRIQMTIPCVAVLNSNGQI